jgi:hypothetical protein
LILGAFSLNNVLEEKKNVLKLEIENTMHSLNAGKIEFWLYIYIFGCTLYFDRQKVNTLRVACSCALYFLYENLHHLPKIGWMMLIKGVHGNHIVLQLIFWFRRKVSLMRMKSSLNRKDFLKMMLKLNPKMDKVTSMLLL